MAEAQFGGMALSELTPTGAIGLMRAVVWHNTLLRLGVHAPLVVVHDIGCVIVGVGQLAGSLRGMGEVASQESWRRLLLEILDTDLARAHAQWKHNDAMVAVVLARALRSIVAQLPEIARVGRLLPLPGDVAHYVQVDPQTAHTRHDQSALLGWMATLCEQRLVCLLAIEQIDVDALRLLELFRGGASDVAGVDLADLYNVLDSSALGDVIDFSLELLPSLLEVRRGKGQQAFGVDGYAAIDRVGHFDNLVLSQLALDDDLFEQRFLNNELFYYTHEKHEESERRTHWVLVDGSASMRGVREVFARGLALALCKRLSLLGENVLFSFFDSRLYEAVRVHPNSHAEVPYALQFRSERGRNYAAVIRQINATLSSRRGQDGQRFVYLLTHGECQFPTEEVQILCARAPVYGVFILPSGPLELGYLDLLHRVHTIDEVSVSHVRRASKARQIIREVEADLERRRDPAGRR
ncbi:MAG: hypothetical protein V3V08_16270 [Nannocystaceae bacterium]